MNSLSTQSPLYNFKVNPMKNLSDLLISINDLDLSLDEILSYLQKSGRLQPFLLEITKEYILQQELEKITEPSNTEIEQVSMEVRLQKQLVNHEKFQQWLAANHTTYDEFRKQIIYRLKLNKLKNQIAAPKLQTTFEERKPQLDRVVLSRIVVDDSDFAQNLKTQIADGAEFNQIAKQYSVVDDAVVGGVMGAVSYGEMPSLIREAIGDSEVGQIVGPVEIDNRYCLLKVKQFIPANLNAELTKKLENEIFQTWLAEKVQQADIQISYPSTSETE